MAIDLSLQGGPIPNPHRKYSAVDDVLDALHGVFLCGCPDCGKAPIRAGKKPGGGYWFSVTLPDGSITRQEGCTLNDAARKWLAVMGDRLLDATQAHRTA